MEMASGTEQLFSAGEWDMLGELQRKVVAKKRLTFVVVSLPESLVLKPCPSR